MGTSDIREPIQKRSIEKKEKIIESGFKLICKQGYHNTNTAEIAKAAGVSTGIVYQYFEDKHDIFICGLEKYADNIFYPIPEFSNEKFNKKDFPSIIENLINNYIENHKLSESAHQEIMAMTHSDEKVSYYFFKREMEITEMISNYLSSNGFSKENLVERVHIMIGIIDNLCHEIVYHKHKEIDYDIMKKIVIENILALFK